MVAGYPSDKGNRDELWESSAHIKTVQDNSETFVYDAYNIKEMSGAPVYEFQTMQGVALGVNVAGQDEHYYARACRITPGKRIRLNLWVNGK
jgi:V8-like Glu-specific endopeptidase